jgi:hypothetical protein
LKECGIKLFNTKASVNRFVSSDKKNEVLSLYSEGLGYRQIKEKTQLGRKAIFKIIKSNNIALHTQTIYTINENYLDNIDSADKARFLGFMYADGNVAKKVNSIKITLKLSDKTYLEGINKSIESNRPLYTQIREGDGSFPCIKKYKKQIRVAYP